MVEMGLKKFEAVVCSWPGISMHPHRFGGNEFRFGDGEVGHIHTGGVVDIPFPRPIRDALLAEGLAQQHRWVPNSGWVTLQIRREGDVTHAIWLMRLSCLRYKLRIASEPQSVLESESQELHLTPKFKSLIMQLLPMTPDRPSPRVQIKVSTVN